jgi:3-oxoacyl-[acyl-carrier protein] reductase
MDLQLKGKVALITGASRGLGFATAQLLAQEGVIVAINSRSELNLVKAATQIYKETQADVLTITGDITEPETPAKIVNKVVSQRGGLDILIANAGGPSPGAFESFSDEDWQTAIELSFLSQVRLIRSAIPYLKLSSDASVLTITSISAKQPIANLVLSNAIRGATIGLTKTLALELGNEGIRFNSILPAATKTERLTQLLQETARLKGTSLEDEMHNQAAKSPLGRICTPQEFANAAVFLVSPAASYFTGTMLSVDGGTYKGIF